MTKKIIPLLAVLILIMAACAPANPSGTHTPAVPSTLETSTAELSTSTGSVDELITMVNGFVTSGEITGQAENGLLAKLDTIKQKWQTVNLTQPQMRWAPLSMRCRLN